MVDKAETDPKPIGEILENPEAIIGLESDPARQYENAQTNAGFEVQALEAQRDALLTEIAENPANDTSEARQRLAELTQTLLGAQADRTVIEHNPPGTEAGK